MEPLAEAIFEMKVVTLGEIVKALAVCWEPGKSRLIMKAPSDPETMAGAPRSFFNAVSSFTGLTAMVGTSRLGSPRPKGERQKRPEKPVQAHRRRFRTGPMDVSCRPRANEASDPS